MAEEQPTKLDKDEHYCFKCKKVIHKSSWNAYYQICDKCVKNSTGR